ncbi:MAG: DinB family protein [Caldilineaceae bacterium]|nr:DinB family protein [Caldilineaceae bacterium]
MDLNYFANVLAQNAERIRALVAGISNEQARWRPGPEEWSMLEVINHLYDEERHDFPVRVDYALRRRGESWPNIDPQGWVTERRYNERDLAESTQNFLNRRQESLAWLRALSDPDWDAIYSAPFGEIRAGDLFASWVAHDILHMRQLVELHWAYTTLKLEPYSTQYAGDW